MRRRRPYGDDMKGLDRQFELFKLSDAFTGNFQEPDSRSVRQEVMTACVCTPVQCDKVFRAVIGFDAINVMDSPARWQFPAMRFLPDEDVFSLIPVIRPRNVDHHIAVAGCFPALPVVGIFALIASQIASLATLRTFIFYTPTNGANILASLKMVFPPSFLATFRRAINIAPPKSAAVFLWACLNLKRFAAESALSRIHIPILSQMPFNVNRGAMQ